IPPDGSAALPGAASTGPMVRIARGNSVTAVAVEGKK
ncbi:MAG: Flp pilus assembly protein CpaB, partial [Methylobacterium sp.]